MRDLIETGAVRPVAGAVCRGGIFSQNSIQGVDLQQLLVQKYPVAAKNYFIKDIVKLSSKIFLLQRFFCRSLRPTLVSRIY